MSTAPIYRGVRLDLGANIAAFNRADESGKTALILAHVETSRVGTTECGVGRHWSSDEFVAQTVASQFAYLAEPTFVHVVLRADLPVLVETDADTLAAHGVGQYAGMDEREVTLAVGSPVEVDAVSWYDVDTEEFTTVAASARLTSVLP